MKDARALILVDLQRDFLPGGPLAVPGGDEVVPVTNRLQPAYGLVVATCDWHPPDHGSFADNHEGREPGEVVDLDGLDQILWPRHCVQDTEGAEFAADLDTGSIARVFRKGTEANIDSYSGFYDNGHRRGTGLHEFLRERGVEAVDVAGLATDVCVKFTALDACRLGYATRVIEDAIRGVDLQEGDSERARAEMKEAGAAFVTSDEVLGGTG